MKVPPARARAFLRAPDAKIRAVLLYGPDGGLVRERARSLVVAVAGDAADPFRVAELTAVALREDPARLADEARAIALTGGRRAIWVREAGDGLTDLFESLLEGPESDSLVVAEAGELPARSRLRVLFESAPEAAAVACYADEGVDLARVIEETLAARGLAVAPDALEYLALNLGGDRLAVRSELEKLALYCAGEREVTLDAAQQCVGDSAEMTLEDLAFAALGGDQLAVARVLARVAEEGTSPVTVLRAVSRHVERLHLAAGIMAGGAGAERAMKALRPQVFFKRESAFRAQLAKWTPLALADALDGLAAAEVDCKTTGLPAETVCSRALVALAARAGRATARAR